MHYCCTTAKAATAIHTHTQTYIFFTSPQSVPKVRLHDSFSVMLGLSSQRHNQICVCVCVCACTHVFVVQCECEALQYTLRPRKCLGHVNPFMLLIAPIMTRRVAASVCACARGKASRGKRLRNREGAMLRTASGATAPTPIQSAETCRMICHVNAAATPCFFIT